MAIGFLKLLLAKTQKKMKITLELDDKTFAQVLLGRVKGTLGLNHDKGVITFNAWNIGRKRHSADVTLRETVSGWLKQSTKKRKVFVSVNRSMGRARADSEILRQILILLGFRNYTKTIDEILDEI